MDVFFQTICQKTSKDSPKYENCKQALKEVSKVCPVVQKKSVLKPVCFYCTLRVCDAVRCLARIKGRRVQVHFHAYWLEILTALTTNYSLFYVKLSKLIIIIFN